MPEEVAEFVRIPTKYRIPRNSHEFRYERRIAR